MDEFEIRKEKISDKTGERGKSRVLDWTLHRDNLPTSALQTSWLTRRLVIGCITAIGLFTIVLTLLLRTSALPDLLGAPNQPKNPQSNLILFTHTVPWGELSLDGHQAYQVNDLSMSSQASGHHSLQYIAPPFPILRCTFTVPASSTDTCPLYRVQSGDFYPSPPARVIDLQCLPQVLSSEQQEALVHAIQNQLDGMVSTSHVMPMEHFTSEDGHIEQASSTFSTSLTYHVWALSDNGQNVLSSGYQQCALFCLDGPTTGSDWRLEVNVVAQWHYTLSDGQSITVSAPSVRKDDSNVENILASVHWAGTWDVSLSESDVNQMICNLAEERLNELSSSSLLTPNLTSIISSTPADGCLIISTQTEGAASSYNPGYVLFHFGVLLAANPTAHQLYPSLPLASTQEATLAAHLAAHT